ncbi:hypothetical protein [Sphingobium yanoikuyae]|uniref:Uncharacterized protein n=1 Tax=Sphingobium yanoikuyae TaxID=13690 RepID=A0A291MXT8_SPHYA|nr:hypothetical protein [Sphingobium yanoikuyae]ATI79917.1 hypothetical protein A6768_07745 [Sphingobium yanoikuyae]
MPTISQLRVAARVPVTQPLEEMRRGRDMHSKFVGLFQTNRLIILFQHCKDSGPLKLVAITMSLPSKTLAGKLKDAWAIEGEKSRARILLCRPGQDPSHEIRQAAIDLEISYIRIDLGQVVTPEQHSMFAANRPRLVAVYGIDRLGAGELPAFGRLTDNGPKTLVIVICPVTVDQAERAMGAWRRLRDLEQSEQQRKEAMLKQAGSV